MNIAFFEDSSFRNFLPLTYTRPVYELICGVDHLHKKVERLFPQDTFMFFTRSYLVPTVSKRHADHQVNSVDAIDSDTLFINGCLLPSAELKQTILTRSRNDMIAQHKDRVAFAFLKEDLARDLAEIFLEPIDEEAIGELKKRARVEEVNNLNLLRYPWELIEQNAEMIRQEFNLVAAGESEGSIDSSVTVYGDSDNLHVGRGSNVEAGVVFDLRDGPVYIGEDTHVETLSRITGPTYIGSSTGVFGAQIREGCTFGDVCRIGGEVVETIIQGHSNKRHASFIGHAYMGEWVNIGAGTINSNLKNTYGTVRVTVAGERIDTGTNFVGCIIGDHAKTSIGAYIFTGKKMGVCSWPMGVVVNDVPSFTIWPKSMGTAPTEVYLESALETGKRAMARRKVQQTEEDRKLLRTIFEMTEGERRDAGVMKGKLEL